MKGTTCTETVCQRNSSETAQQNFNQTKQKASVYEEEDLGLFKWKGHTFLHQVIITKLQKYFHDIITSFLLNHWANFIIYI